MIIFHSGMIPFPFWEIHSGDVGGEFHSSSILEWFISILEWLIPILEWFHFHSGMIPFPFWENHSGDVGRKTILVSFWNDLFSFWNDSTSILGKSFCTGNEYHSILDWLYFHSGMIPFSFWENHSGDVGRENDSSLILEWFIFILDSFHFHSAGMSLRGKWF